MSDEVKEQTQEELIPEIEINSTEEFTKDILEVCRKYDSRVPYGIMYKIFEDIRIDLLFNILGLNFKMLRDEISAMDPKNKSKIVTV